MYVYTNCRAWGYFELVITYYGISVKVERIRHAVYLLVEVNDKSSQQLAFRILTYWQK